MRKYRLQMLVLLVLAFTMLPMMPAAAQSSCTISTRGTVRLRAGHSINDAIVGTMPRNTALQVVERFVEQIGRRTRIWYRLVNAEAAPTATSEQVWVGGTVTTKGDCVNISTASTAPAAPASGSVSPVSGILPQNGRWTLTYGSTVNISCDGTGTADFATGQQFGQSVFTVNVTSSAGGFAFNSISYTQDTNGTWHGFYAPSGSQAKGEAYIRIDSSTRMLGDIVVSILEVPGCTFKIPFWAVPQ